MSQQKLAPAQLSKNAHNPDTTTLLLGIYPKEFYIYLKFICATVCWACLIPMYV